MHRRKRELRYDTKLNIRIRNFFSTKDTIKRIKRQPVRWDKIFKNHIYDKELVSRICKELSKPNRRYLLSHKMNKQDMVLPF